MNIKRLYLKNFKKFKEKTIDFEVGLNTIYGKNEQGKSTILIALLTVLFFDSNTKSSKLLDKISPWGGSIAPFIRLEYTNEGINYLLEKDFQNNTQILKNLISGKIIADNYSKITNVIKSHSGIGSEQVFILTSLIAQNDIARVGSTKEKQPIKSLREAIDSSLLGSSKVEATSVLSDLNKSINDLNKGLDHPAKYPGIIKSLKNQLDDLLVRSEEISNSLMQVQSSTHDHNEDESELKSIKEELSQLESLFKNNEIREKSNARLKELGGLINELEKRIQEIERLEIKIKLIEKERTDISIEGDIKELEYRSLELKTLLADKTNELQITENHLKDLEDELKLLNKKKSKNIKISCGCITLVSVLIFFFMNFSFVPLIGGGIIIVGIFIYFDKIFGREIFENRIELNQKIGEIKVQIDHLEEEKLRFYKQNKISSESELVSLNSRIQLLDSEISGYRAGLKTLVGTSGIEDLQNELRSYSKEKIEIEQNVLTDEIVASHIDPMDKFSKNRRLEDLRRQKIQLEESLMKSKIEKESSRFTQEDLNLIEEEVQEIRKQKSYFEKKLKILKLVEENIEKARVEVLKQSGSVISKFAKEFLPLVTESKYSDIKITDSFQFLIFSEEKNDWIVPDSCLSQGTIDQIYFIIRLAILSIICKESFPPIIIDDAFVTFDNIRLKGVQALLKKVSSKYQIILLSCHKDYNDWGNLINL